MWYATAEAALPSEARVIPRLIDSASTGSPLENFWFGLRVKVQLVQLALEL